MKLILISDTHGLHRNLKVPSGDVLIHAGDFCDYGNLEHLHDFLAWFDEQEIEHKIFIAGNHDSYAYNHPEDFQVLIPAGLIYLNDSGTHINGRSIWGSPITPDMPGWAFGKRRGESMKVHWDMIPENVDILITHTPPFGVLDKPRVGNPFGCEELTKKVIMLQPKLHVFGHVHASYGQHEGWRTLFVNASSVNSQKVAINPPIVVEV